jgi:hypothetical protein
VEVHAAAASTTLARSTQKLTQLGSFPQHAVLAFERLAGVLGRWDVSDYYLFVVHPELGFAFGSCRD